MTAANHYETLGVGRTATGDEIRKAYRSEAQKHHPDRGGDAERMQSLNEARDTLLDDQARAAYDQELDLGPDGAQLGRLARECLIVHFKQVLAALDLTDIARKFHGSDQLRDRIANRLASRPPAPARDASAVERWRDLVRAVRFLEVDHARDGFPVVRMSMLSAMASEIESLAAEVDELHALRDRLGDLLSRTAVALRGPEPPLTRWSWHDVPDRAAAAIAAIDVMQRAAQAAAAAQHSPRSPTVDECEAAGRGPDNGPGKPFDSGGMPDTPEERARFEAYMRGHCWGLSEYDASMKSYPNTVERMLYGVWRDRGALPTIYPNKGA